MNGAVYSNENQKGIAPILMKKLAKILASMSVIFIFGTAEAADISLPTPNISKSKMVAEMLNERHSSRDLYGNLTQAQLSKILWAANGITNRYDAKGHVNPAALGIYSVDVYAVTADGIYLYKPEKHALELVQKGDYRETTTTEQDFAKNAPLNLVYVENSSAWKNSPHPVNKESQLKFAYIAAGAMSQSVALMATSEDLGNCVRGSIDEKAFTKAAKLSANQKIILAQSIGESDNVVKG